MSRQARSARGQVVDFDLLAIKQQLATTPVAVSVNERRKFIDQKDGVKSKQVQIEPTHKTKSKAVASALSLSVDSANTSARVTKE